MDTQAQNQFTADYQLTPYWWDKTPRPSITPGAIPGSVDVVVVGSGYTGLNAALVTARAGRSTLVFDAGDAGYGCSTRNGGQISTSIKPDLDKLTHKYGTETAVGILQEGRNALSWIEEFINNEGIDCDFRVCGRFHAAHSKAAYEKLIREVQDQPQGLESPYRIVPREEQTTELGTDAYHGGVLYENHASLDPAGYHQGLLNSALSCGVQVVPDCAVSGIVRNANGFRVTTRQGEVQAAEVVIATNGYTGTISPWQRRRVIPIGSYIIATDAIEPALMQTLMPNNRIYSDTKKVVYYYRASPDRKRIVFGGRVSVSETDPMKSAPKLKADLDKLFPQLKSVKISHSWMGFVAYTFDELAHVGQYEGVHYAMGYCGSGVSMASYLGMRAGQQVLGLPEGRTAFDGIPFPTRPLYTGKPWFLSSAVAWYRFKDRFS